jgi:hypothetical protein
MFRAKTVFVIGAGASREAGLPTSAELKGRIAEKLNLTYSFTSDPYSPSTGDPEIAGALFQHVTSTGNRDINPYLYEAWKIRDGMAQAMSIDNFLDAHAGNPGVELCGKLAIALSIVQAEQQSSLFIDERKQEKFLPEKLRDTWYEKYFRKLVENVRLQKIENIFENVSFIIFNYDRCVEHFLYHSLQRYYALSERDAAFLVDRLIVSHPYGLVGKLPWQANAQGVSFGGQHRGMNLLGIAKQIRTFAERVEDQAALESIRSQIRDAETVIFLGFAFHPSNMELIIPPETTSKRIFGTAKGISDHDLGVIHSQISNVISVPPQMGRHILDNRLTCSEFFGYYWHSLSDG